MVEIVEGSINDEIILVKSIAIIMKFDTSENRDDVSILFSIDKSILNWLYSS